MIHVNNTYTINGENKRKIKTGVVLQIETVNLSFNEERTFQALEKK